MKSKDISRPRQKPSLRYRTKYFNRSYIDGETMYELAKDLQIRLQRYTNTMDSKPKDKEEI